MIWQCFYLWIPVITIIDYVLNLGLKWLGLLHLFDI